MGLQCLGCPAGFTFDNTTLRCKCPDNAPYSNGVSCFSCSLPNFWNVQTLRCETCPANTVFNTQLGTCVGCPSDTPIVLDGQCVGCPTGTKYLNGMCVSSLQSCSGGRIFNTTTQTCSCPSGTVYDVSVAKCTTCGNLQIYNYNTQRCEYCPSTAPIFYNGACAACPVGSHYDPTQNKCLTCPDTFIYNSVTGQC